MSHNNVSGFVPVSESDVSLCECCTQPLYPIGTLNVNISSD